MTHQSLPNFITELVGAALQIFEDHPAPLVFPSYFLFLFFIPLYLMLLGARSACIEFRGWLMPRHAQRLAACINRVCTLLLAGFLPGWLTTIALYIWSPQLTPDQGLMAGFFMVVGFAAAYNILLVRTVPGLSDALGRGFWHAVPMGGFYFCAYVGAFLGSAEAVLLAFTFLFAPFGVVAILPFAASGWAAAKPVTPGPGCMLCSEPADAAPIRCSKCDSTYHSECWDYSEGCARKACRITSGEPVALG